MIKRGVLLGLALLLTIGALAVALSFFLKQATPALQPTSITKASTIILDAGHGGEDGGAVSVTGLPESQINLELVLKMDSILGFYGTAPVLLREDDRSLHDEDAITLREKKVSDLKNRVARVEAIPNATLISIHQNTYQDSRYHGTQVFYTQTPGSEELAGHVQAMVQSYLQFDNNRQSKQIPDSVYLMNHITCPAILVECGFLTNPEEEANLRDSTYQKKLAAVLCAAWLTAQDEVISG